MEFLEFICNTWWRLLLTIIASTIILSLIFDFIYKLYVRFFRHWVIMKHGYPPEHCDADGDFFHPECKCEEDAE